MRRQDARRAGPRAYPPSDARYGPQVYEADYEVVEDPWDHTLRECARLHREPKVDQNAQLAAAYQTARDLKGRCINLFV